jgi:hypothetical protein
MKLSKRKKMMIILIPVAICALVIVLMQLGTNSIMREIKAAFYCPDFYVQESLYRPTEYPDLYADPNVHYVIYKYDPDKPNIYAHFNITSHSIATKHLDEVNIELKLHRIFTWHNFNKGTLWIKYTVMVSDKKGNHIFGGKDIPVRLSIQKINGKWGVTSLYEAP